MDTEAMFNYLQGVDFSLHNSDEIREALHELYLDYGITSHEYFAQMVYKMLPKYDLDHRTMLAIGCVRVGNVKALQYLLDTGVDLSYGVLLWQCHCPEVAELLMSYGARLAYTHDDNGWYPFTNQEVSPEMTKYWEDMGVVRYTPDGT